MADEFEQARNVYNQVAGMVPGVMDAIFGAHNQGVDASQRQAGALKTGAEAAGNVDALTAEQAISTDQLTMQLLQAVGLDVNDPASKLRQEMDRSSQMRVKREATAAQLDELASINFFENPFAYFAAQPELQKLTVQHNQLADLENNAENSIQRMQSLATTVKSVTPARAADLLRKTAAEQGKARMAAAEAQSAQLDMNSAAGSAKAFLDAMTLNRNVFHDLLGLQSAQLAAEDRDRRYKDAKEKAEAEDAEISTLQTGIEKYMTMLRGPGAPKMTREDIKRMPAQERSMWYDIIWRGNFGNSYAQSLPLIGALGNVAEAANSGNAEMMHNVQKLDTQVTKRAQELKAQSQATGQKLSDKEAHALALQQLYNRDKGYTERGVDKTGMERDSVFALDYDGYFGKVKANPAAAGIIGTVLAEQKVAKPYVPLNAAINENMLLDRISQKVVEGKATPAQAAEETARFFAEQTARTYDAGGLRYLGLPRVQDWQIKSGPTGNRPVDMMNSAQLENYFQSQISASRMFQVQPGGGLFIPLPLDKLFPGNAKPVTSVAPFPGKGDNK